MKTEHVFILVGGGLGDVFRLYFSDYHPLSGAPGDGIWGRLDEIKRLSALDDVDLRIEVIGSTHNMEQIEAFFKYHPHIDKVYQEPWQLSGEYLRQRYKDNGYRELSSVIVDMTAIPWTRPIVHLPEWEKTFVASLKHPYAVLYPFTGLAGLQPWPMDAYGPVIEDLKEAGYSVYAIGGSYIRQSGIDATHVIQHSPRGAVDCTGLGARVSAQMTIEADVFIGAFSCYTLVRQAFEKDTILLMEKWMLNHMESNASVDAWAYRKPFTHAVSVVDRSVEEVTNEVMQIVKGE